MLSYRTCISLLNGRIQLFISLQMNRGADRAATSVSTVDLARLQGCFLSSSTSQVLCSISSCVFQLNHCDKNSCTVALLNKVQCAKRKLTYPTYSMLCHGHHLEPKCVPQGHSFKFYSRTHPSARRVQLSIVVFQLVFIASDNQINQNKQEKEELKRHQLHKKPTELTETVLCSGKEQNYVWFQASHMHDFFSLRTFCILKGSHKLHDESRMVEDCFLCLQRHRRSD